LNPFWRVTCCHKNSWPIHILRVKDKYAIPVYGRVGSSFQCQHYPKRIIPPVP
jgi:hypothetical protein